MKTLIVTIIIILVNLVFPQKDVQFITGRLMINTTKPLVVFPKEIYGVYVSYSIDEDSIQIESVLYQEFDADSRKVIKEEIIEYLSFKEKYPKLRNSVKLNFPQEIIKIFKKYNVYSIRRISKIFFPSGTIPHYISRRGGKRILVKSRNENKSLLIFFNKNHNVLEISNELQNKKYISSVQPDQPIDEGPEFDGPQLLKFSVPELPDSIKSKKIEGMTILKVLVDENGNVADLGVIKSDLNINEILIKTVKSWKFVPGKRDHKPTQLWLALPIVYKNGKMVKPKL